MNFLKSIVYTGKYVKIKPKMKWKRIVLERILMILCFS